MLLTMYQETVGAKQGAAGISFAQPTNGLLDKPNARTTDVIPGLLHALGEFYRNNVVMRSSLARIAGERHVLAARPVADANYLLEFNEKEGGSHLDLISKLTEALIVAANEGRELAETAEYIGSGSIYPSKGDDSREYSR